MHAEPWLDEQIARRYTGIAHVFHYTIEQIEALELAFWVGLAVAWDEYKAENDRARAKTRSGRRRR